MPFNTTIDRLSTREHYDFVTVSSTYQMFDEQHFREISSSLARMTCIHQEKHNEQVLGVVFVDKEDISWGCEIPLVVSESSTPILYRHTPLFAKSKKVRYFALHFLDYLWNAQNEYEQLIVSHENDIEHIDNIITLLQMQYIKVLNLMNTDTNWPVITIPYIVKLPTPTNQGEYEIVPHRKIHTNHYIRHMYNKFKVNTFYYSPSTEQLFYITRYNTKETPFAYYDQWAPDGTKTSGAITSDDFPMDLVCIY